MIHQASDIEQLYDLGTITLPEMKSISLMNRVDTKYVTSSIKLASLLEKLKDNYLVQVINDSRVSSYESIYYDTDDLRMYLDHHNKHLNRQKIRTRLYVESDLAFLEIKNKNNKSRTNKIRIEIPTSIFENGLDDPVVRDFITNNSKFPVDTLSPSLRTSFKRITLTNIEKTERITIDTALGFTYLRSGVGTELPKLMIIEVKQDSSKSQTMRRILREMSIFPRKISKYCVGMVLTNPMVKRNRFKGKILYINKINSE